MKIAILGYSGSGKSTLAKALGEKYGEAVLHLDQVHFLPGWQERARAEEAAMVSDFLDSHDGWVIDGNYSALSYGRRLEEADRIVLLAFSRVACLLRVVRRYRSNKGRTRDSAAQGCPEKLDWEFVRWVLRDGRTKRARDRYARILQTYGAKTVILKNQRQLDAFRNGV